MSSLKRNNIQCIREKELPKHIIKCVYLKLKYFIDEVPI